MLGNVLSRSPDVRATPIGQSLAECDVRVSKRLWKELARVLDARSSAGRVEAVLEGMDGDGYTAVWALTESDLLVLCEKEGASRAVAFAEISGVVPIGRILRVLMGGREFIDLTAYVDLTSFARALATRARAPVGSYDGLFTDAGYVPFAGATARIAGQSLGAFGDVAAGGVVVCMDDAGIHLATAAQPWRRVAIVPWDEVRELAVEGHEETIRRVTVARFMLLGPLAVAVPKDENASRAYLTVAAAAGDLVVRVNGVSPPELRVRLGDALRRVPAAAGDGADLAGQIARLGELHGSGVLTDAEFAAAKRKLLGL
jgi:Short C-terminal domain